MKSQQKEVEFAVECKGCGTMIGFFTDRCPMCGKKFSARELDLVGLFKNTRFGGSQSKDKLKPVISEDNVLFVHLDVQSGKVDFVQGIGGSFAFKHRERSISRA